MIRLVAALITAVSLLGAQEKTEFKLLVEELVLENGMRILVVERHEVPRVFCSLWWRVGSVNERPGLTGLSHFFEHMMFKGTERIGTTDPKKDAELNQKIEQTMEKSRAIKLARLEAKRRGLPPDPKLEEDYKVLWKQYEELVAEQKKISVGEHLSKIYQSHGGTGLNATTSNDRTNYFVELPTNKIEVFFWLESDRFSKPVFREFYSEREVVKEERRLRYDSTPTGLINESFWAMFWQSHPYKWPVIGWMSDIDQYTLADAQRYFDTHYSPQNCTAIFVGNVKASDVFTLAKKYFGQLKRFKTNPDPIVTQEPEQTVERRISSEADAQPQLSIRWHAPSGVHKETPCVELLTLILSGRSGRLHLPLVEDKKLALNTSSFYWSLKYGGLLQINATPRPNVKFEDLEAAITEIVEEIRKNGITERELQKVKNQAMVELFQSLESYYGISQQLGYYETIGTWHDMFAFVKGIEKTTAEDIKRCAVEYLRPNARNILWIKRKEKK